MNSAEQKAWRSLQIAATILYRYFGDIVIEPSSTPLYDILVKYNDGTNLQFGVNVKNSTYIKSRSYQSAVELLSSFDYSIPDNRIPVLLLCVNESTETARFGFQIGWMYGRLRIFKDIELRSLNQNNANKTLQIIKSMDDVIRVLSTNDINVCKDISFSIESPKGIINHGNVIYLRKFSANYKMQQVEVVDEKEKFNRLLHGIPENEYPSDLLDEVILAAIKQRYNNAEVHSKTILFSTDLRDLQFYEGMHNSLCFVNVSPDLSALPQQYWSIVNGIERVSLILELYVPGIFNLEIFDNQVFNTTLPFEGWLEKYASLNEMKNTVSTISEYFTNHRNCPTFGQK